MAGRERRDLRCQMHRGGRRWWWWWARNSGEKGACLLPPRLMSRNRPAGRKKGRREHEVGRGAAESGRPDHRNREEAGWGWLARRGGGPVRPSSSSSSSSFPHQPPARARPATCRARQLGDPGPRASARRAPWTGRCPWPWGAAGWSGQWRRASDRILIFRLGRAGAGRGGVGRDASADRIPPVPRGRRHSAETAGRGVAGRAGSWNGNASAARSGRGRCRSR